MLVVGFGFPWELPKAATIAAPLGRNNQNGTKGNQVLGFSDAFGSGPCPEP